MIRIIFHKNKISCAMDGKNCNSIFLQQKHGLEKACISDLWKTSHPG